MSDEVQQVASTGRSWRRKSPRLWISGPEGMGYALEWSNASQSWRLYGHGFDGRRIKGAAGRPDFDHASEVIRIGPQ